MFFNNTNESLGPGLLRITYNAENYSIEDYKLAFYSKNSDIADEYIYTQLTDEEGAYSDCVTNVRYDGKFILADGVAGFINLYGLEIGGSYDTLLEECQNDEYMKEYGENAYFNWDFYKGIYFYDEVTELDLSILEKDFSWNEGKDLTQLQSLLVYNEYAFTADDGSDRTLEVRIVDDNMCGLMLFTDYLSPMGTDDYRIDGNTLYVVSNGCCYNEVWHSYLAQLDFNGDKLTATFYLYGEDEEVTLDNYADKTPLQTLAFDCTAK